jgi:hypothetical protein
MLMRADPGRGDHQGGRDASPAPVVLTDKPVQPRVVALHIEGNVVFAQSWNMPMAKRRSNRSMARQPDLNTLEGLEWLVAARNEIQVLMFDL